MDCACLACGNLWQVRKEETVRERQCPSCDTNWVVTENEVDEMANQANNMIFPKRGGLEWIDNFRAIFRSKGLLTHSSDYTLRLEGLIYLRRTERMSLAEAVQALFSNLRRST
jgi:hypothetical protein